MSWPQSDWSCLYIDGHNDVCAMICPVVYILESIPSFGCFCFPLFYISMDFLFNLGQHCEGRQGIDFCPRGLTGTRMSLSSWGFAAGCDNAQNIPLNLSANLLPNRANLGITWCLPPQLRWAVTYTLLPRESGDGKYLIVKQKVWYSGLTEHGSRRRILSSNAGVQHPRHTEVTVPTSWSCLLFQKWW